MKSVAPNGTTIPASTNFSANFSRLLKITDHISGNTFTSPNSALDLNTVLTNGKLSGINDPILDSQGATYAYALANSSSGTPGGVINNVQYNLAGVFNGSASLTYDNITSTLVANKISNGTVEINSNTITGLTDPISGQQAATKNYVDNIVSLSVNTNNTAGSIIYSANEIVNSILYRNNQTSGTVSDVLPTAAEIIAATGAIVGTTLSFGIKNTSSDYLSIVTFTAGTGIIIGNTQNIFSGYHYSGIMIVNNIDSGTESITLYSMNCSMTNTINWETEIGGTASVVNTVRVTDYQMIYNSPVDITSIPQISPSDVTGKVIYLSPGSPGLVVMKKPELFMGVFAGTSIISSPFIWTTGGMDFYIINESVVPGATLTLSGETGSISWTLDINSNLTIPPGYTGWFMVSLVVSNYPELASLTSAKVTCLGIFENI